MSTYEGGSIDKCLDTPVRRVDHTGTELDADQIRWSYVIYSSGSVIFDTTYYGADTSCCVYTWDGDHPAPAGLRAMHTEHMADWKRRRGGE